MFCQVKRGKCTNYVSSTVYIVTYLKYLKHLSHSFAKWQKKNGFFMCETYCQYPLALVSSKVHSLTCCRAKNPFTPLIMHMERSDHLSLYSHIEVKSHKNLQVVLIEALHAAQNNFQWKFKHKGSLTYN